MMKACYRFIVKEARKHFFNHYSWYKIEPTKENLRLFFIYWIELQFSKIQEGKK